MILMDSGVGGLSVARALRAARPGIPLTYIADTGFFPYGGREAKELRDRAIELLRRLQQPQALVVLACNTLSTLCLAELRAALPNPFIGTVPAIKVAAEQSVTRRFTLLATPNTVHSAYTDQLVGEFAADCVVDAYGAPNLVRYAEALLLGETIDDGLIASDIAPCFVDDALGKTDAVILGCTHFPMILERLKGVNPWSVNWIDSSEAIARRALSQLTDVMGLPATSTAYVTRPEDIPRYTPLFKAEGFDHVGCL